MMRLYSKTMNNLLIISWSVGSCAMHHVKKKKKHEQAIKKSYKPAIGDNS